MPLWVAPSSVYKASFLEAIAEQVSEPLQGLLGNLQRHLGGRESLLAWLETHFDEYIHMLTLAPTGTHLPLHYAPQIHTWLIDKHHYVGRLIVRPHLTTQKAWDTGHISYEVRPTKRRQGYGKLLINQGLLQARARGLSEVYLITQPKNKASLRLITHAGGVLIDTVARSQWIKERYRISL